MRCPTKTIMNQCMCVCECLCVCVCVCVLCHSVYIMFVVCLFVLFTPFHQTHLPQDPPIPSLSKHFSHRFFSSAALHLHTLVIALGPIGLSISIFYCVTFVIIITLLHLHLRLRIISMLVVIRIPEITNAFSTIRPHS